MKVKIIIHCNFVHKKVEMHGLLNYYNYLQLKGDVQKRQYYDNIILLS